MDGGVVVMDIARIRVNSKKLAAIIPLPVAYADKEVEVIVRDVPETSAIDELYGTASNVRMTDEELRSMRLQKYAPVH